MNIFFDQLLKKAQHQSSNIFCEVWVDDVRTVITWADLLHRSLQFASFYRQNGAINGDIVCIILKHHPDIYPAFIGAMLAGAVPSFLPFPTPKQDKESYWSTHEKVFARTNAKLIVTYAELKEQIESRIVNLGASILDHADAHGVEPIMIGRNDLPPSSQLALLQHSSGTTGLKKGVMLTYDAITRQLTSYQQALNITHDTDVKIATWLPLYHDMGLIACFMLPFFSGYHILSIDAFDWTARPAKLFEIVETGRATHMWLPNFAFNHLVRAVPRRASHDLSSLQAIIDCSEPCKQESFDKFIERFSAFGVERTALQTCYAMAESVFAVSQSDTGKIPRSLWIDAPELRSSGVVRILNEPDAKADAIRVLSSGPPLDGIEIAILKDGAFMPDGRTGEVLLRGSFMFSGYFNDEETSKNSYHEQWYKTGDVGFMLDGEIYITGRLKDIIIVNGKNIHAHDIEETVNQVSGIKPGRAVAFGMYDEVVGSEKLIIVAERDGAHEDQEIITSLNSAITANFGITPSDIRLVAEGWLVKTTSGKIGRGENMTKYKQKT